jgi:DNA polymerase
MSAALEALAREASACVACELSGTRTHVVFASGPAAARLMLVGEAPGAEEDRTGTPFVGRSGALLDRVLSEVGLERAGIYVTSAVKCRPPGNRNPRPGELRACERFLAGQLALVRPSVVVCLGATAARSILGSTATISSLRGRVHPLDGSSAEVLVTYHPAAGLRGGPSVVAKIREDLAAARALLGAVA